MNTPKPQAERDREDALAFLQDLAPKDPQTKKRVYSALLRSITSDRSGK